MRKLIFPLVALSLTPTAYAQIPVTDAASLSQAVTAHVESVAKYVEQINQLKAQVEQARQQYAALTGARGLGTILNDPRVREYLPADWQRVYDAVRSGGYGGLTGAARQIYDKNKIYDICNTFAQEDRNICQTQLAKPSQDLALAQEAYTQAQARIGQIESLMGRINLTEDPKAIAELQGRIAAEQALVQNEQTKLQLFALISQAQDRIQQQRRHEMFMQEAAKTGTPIPQQIDWSRP